MTQCYSFIFVFLFFTVTAYAETIKLKSGNVVEAKIIEKNKDYLKVDFQGITLTYYQDEIASVDGVEGHGNVQVKQDEKVNTEQLPKTVVLPEEKEPAFLGSNLYEEVKKYYIELSANLLDQELKSLDSPVSEEAKNLILKNQKAIELFKEAVFLKTDGFILANKPAELNAASPLPRYFSHIALFKLILIESKQYFAQQAVEKAQQDILVNVRFLQHLSQQKYGMMVSLIVENICWNMLEPFIEKVTEEKLSKDIYAGLLKELTVLNTDHNSLADIFKEEREIAQGNIKMLEQETIKQGKNDPSFWKKVYETYDQETAPLYQALFDACDQNSPEVYISKAGALLQKLKGEANVSTIVTDRAKNLFSQSGWKNSPEIVAKQIIIPSIIENPRGVLDRYYFLVARINNNIAAIAVKLFYLDKAKYPGALQELVPAYIQQVPADPFNNFNPINYKLGENKILIYSFGPDRNDQQGVTAIFLDSFNVPKGQAYVAPSGDIVAPLKE